MFCLRQNLNPRLHLVLCKNIESRLALCSSWHFHTSLWNSYCYTRLEWWQHWESNPNKMNGSWMQATTESYIVLQNPGELWKLFNGPYFMLVWSMGTLEESDARPVNCLKPSTKPKGYNWVHSNHWGCGSGFSLLSGYPALGHKVHTWNLSNIPKAWTNVSLWPHIMVFQCEATYKTATHNNGIQTFSTRPCNSISHDRWAPRMMTHSWGMAFVIHTDNANVFKHAKTHNANNQCKDLFGSCMVFSSMSMFTLSLCRWRCIFNGLVPHITLVILPI